MPTLVAEKQRDFAVAAIRKLREAGFEAYWAGGCVRDRLLGNTPKDYDIATNATPPQIRRLFGYRRTLAIGAAFGVINVLGPKGAGQVEVTTFRRDAAYSDGRHPDSVTFGSSKDDASRRDFTINGLFYDPIEDKVIDFVDGQDDLRQGVLRAIGSPRERFAEDKLRMLRAVRFSATFGFQLEAETLRAVGEMARDIAVVSPERIAMEMRRMLVEPGRVKAVRLLVDTGLAASVLPELIATEQFESILVVLDRLKEPSFPLALGALLYKLVDTAGARQVCSRWRLSNDETDRVCRLVSHFAVLGDARVIRWSTLQPILVAKGIDDLLALREAASPGCEEAAYCRSLLEQPRDVLDPTPLITGDDLLAHGIPTGPRYRHLLWRVRAAQLDEEIHTKDEALALVDQLLQEV